MASIVYWDAIQKLVLSSESLSIPSVGLQGNCIASPWHSVHCDLPLAPWVIKGLINESIRVCVLLSACICDVVRPRRAHSPVAQRKGMPLLAGLMNWWHALP